MSWAPPQKPDVQITPVVGVLMPVEFHGLPFYFSTLEVGKQVSFASYYEFPQRRTLYTDTVVTAKAEFRGEECFEVERHTRDEAGNLTSRSLFYVAVRRDEIRWLLRIRRNPGQPVSIEEPTATFPRRLEPDMEWGHRRVRGVVTVSINNNHWRCLEIESSSPLDPHLNRLYINSDGHQVYNRRFLRADAATKFAIPDGTERISHHGAEYASYYEDFPDFALRPPL